MVGEPVIRLVVCADDVGLHPAITRAAIEAHTSGLVTAASVLCASRHWVDTADALARAPDLDVGVHLTLCEGTPVLGRDDVPSLVAGDGCFPLDLRRVVGGVLSGRVRIEQVRREWLAQVRRVQGAGLVVGHLDGHKHIHALPKLAAVAVSVARECGVGALRVPREPGPGPRRGVRLLLRVLGRPLAERARRAGLLTPDRVAGIGCAGGLTVERLAGLVEGLSPGLTELVAHPGVDQEGLRRETAAQGLDWTGGYRFEDELEALCSAEVRSVVERRRIVLTTYRAEAARR